MTKFEWEKQLSKYLSELRAPERQRILDYYSELFEDKYESGEREEVILASFGHPSDVAMEILRNYSEDGTTGFENRGGAGITPLPQPIERTRKPQYNFDPNTGKPVGKRQKNTYQDTPPQAYDRNDYRQNTAPSNSAPASGWQSYNDQPQSKGGGAKTVIFIILAVLFGGAFIGIVVAVWATIISLIVSSIAMAAAGAAAAVGSLIVGVGGAQKIACMGIALVIMGIGIILIPLTIKLFKFSIKMTGKFIKWIMRVFFGKSEVAR